MSSTLRVGNCGGRLDNKEKRRNSAAGRGDVDSIKVRNSACFWQQTSAQSCYQHAEDMRLLIVSKTVHSLKYGINKNTSCTGKSSWASKFIQ